MKLGFNIFSRSYAPLNLFTLMYYCNSLSSHLLSNHTTKFHETFSEIRTYYVVVHINGKLRFNFFPRSYAPLNLFTSMFYCNSLLWQLLSNHTTEFHETFSVNKDILCSCAYRREIAIQFFF